MKTVMELLRADSRVSDWKINENHKESYELFFVKGKLETVRCTDTCDKQVTVYADHGEYKGDSQFFIYPSTTQEQIRELIGEAVEKAKLIDNPAYDLLPGETGTYAVETDFDQYDAAELAAKIANTVFASNTLPHTSLNAVEIFINRITETVANSRGLHKTQVRWTAMVEAIPTATGNGESVELYEQVNFNALDLGSLSAKISEKLNQAAARHDAKRIGVKGVKKVILNPQELMELFWNFAYDLHYSSVYTHGNVYSRGDALQSAPLGDKLTLGVAGVVPGCASSRCIDRDGMTLENAKLIENGRVIGYYGSSRYGQYLGEVPTGELPCLVLGAGSAGDAEFAGDSCLEIVSMSGIQTDFYADYVGGEIRLAYWHNCGKIIPVTGLSVSGKLSDVLNNIRFSRETTVMGSYCGPRKAVIEGMNIF